MPKILIPGFKCNRCQYEWAARIKEGTAKGEDGYPENAPKLCPDCKSPYWDKPRVRPLKVTLGAKPKGT